MEVLQRDASHAIVRDQSAALRDGEKVINAKMEGEVEEIADGSPIEIVQ